MQVSMGTGNAPIDGSAIRNVLVREGSVVFLNDVIAEPTAASGDGSVVLYRYGGALKYWNGTSAITLAAGGGGGTTPTYESLFAYDQTFNITPDTTWTIQGNRATATAVVTLANIAGGSGAVLAFSNLGSGNDITGTSSLWSVTAAGVATFAGISVSGTSSAFANTGAAVWTMVDNTATALTFDATGKTGILKFTTTDGAEGIATSGFLTVSGKITGGVGSNTVSSAVITDNTVTTFGNNASSAGVVVIRSTSLTTGALLQLQTAETTLNGGYYLVARDSVAGANVFTIGELGANVITGVAGSDMVTITAGDLNMGSGRIYATYATNGAILSLTNNTVTSTNNVLVTGSGTFTGVGASSYFNITASGLTTGTALTVIANTATTSVGVVDIATTGLTSGSSLRITESTANFTTGAKAIEVNLVAATAGNGLTVTTTGAYAGTGLAVLTAGAMTSGIVLSLISTTGLTSGSVIRATTSTAGLIATNGAFSFTATGNFTSGAATLGAFHVGATTTAAGTIASILGGALITGVGLYISDSGTGITSGSLLRLVSATTGVVATNGIFSFNASGVYTSGAATVGAFHVAGAATVAGTIMSILGGAQTTGVALYVSDPSTGMTLGSLIRAVTATTGAVATNGIVSVQASGAYTSTANVGLFNVLASAAIGAATLVSIAASAASQTATELLNVTQSGATITAYTGNLINVVAGFSGTSSTGNAMLITGVHTTAGNALKVIANSITLGAATGILVSHTTSVLGAGSSLVRISSTGVDTGTTTGVLLDLATTAAAGSTQVLLSDSSADTGARIGIFSKVTNAAAVLAIPLKVSSVAVVSSHFYRLQTWSNGTQNYTMWCSDGTTPNGALTGTAGDFLVGADSGKAYICTTGTTWAALS